ncbi:MAG: hypothetical protein AAF533_11380 [Acidobacteriota bacterium]
MTAPVAFIGDSHLLPDESSVPEFIEFLRTAPGRYSRLVLLGDIFDLWIARPAFHDDHHEEVLAAFHEAEQAGFPIDYTVGNRDYAVETLRPSPFDRVEPEVLAERPEQPRWLAEHGDLVNQDDRQYQGWRRFSRSRFVLGPVCCLPSFIGKPLSLWLERKMRTTNLAYKRRFPLEHVQRRAAAQFAETGARHLVLGHFHEERHHEVEGGEVWVLPDWKRSHRHLEWDGESMRFAPSF